MPSQCQTTRSAIASRLTKKGRKTMARPLLLLAAFAALSPALAAQSESGVAQALEKLTKAFNAGDAKALAQAFSEEGELDLDGEGKLQGRAAIEADYAKLFKDGPKARLEIDVDKQRKVGSDVIAVEGRARVLRPDQASSRSAFSALLVRKDGAWLIDSVRETSLPDPGSAEHLKGLAWMNGHWRYAKDDVAMEVESAEVANGNFRSNRFRLTFKKEVLHEGTQILGWDPVKKQIRSWVFSSDGSFGEGYLEKSGDRYVLRVAGVLPDGAKSTATQILTPDGANRFTWQVSDRSVEGRVLPNVDPIQLVREEKQP